MSFRLPGAAPARTPGLPAFCCASLLAFTMAGVPLQAQIHQTDLQRTEAASRRNTGVLEALRAYQEGGAAVSAPRLAALKEAAARRYADLTSLAVTDPAAVLAAALPDDLRNAVPAEVRGFIEEHVSLQGEIQVAVEDGPNYSRLHHSLKLPGRSLDLHFADRAPVSFQTGDSVQIEGVRVGEQLATTSDGTTSRSTAIGSTGSSSVLPNTFGAQKTLVVLVNFQDEALQPVTASYVSDALFGSAGSVSSWWLENSFQQTWATGDVAGWYTIPVSSSACDMTSISSSANSAAQGAGYVLSNYRHLVYIFPNNACSWWGYSSIGGSPTQTWIRNYTNDPAGVALLNLTHELGHSLGLYHSHGWNCSSYPASGCTSNDYGDTLDVMGNADFVTAPHYDSFQKERLGWLGYSSQPAIQTVSSSGTYTLAPYETQDSGVKALKIPQSNGAYYYIEYRTAIGFDGFLSGNSNVLNGVVLRLGTPGSADTSELLNIPSPSAETLSPALDVAQTYTDSSAALSVSPVATGGTASVQITLQTAPCTQANPTMSIAGPSGSVAPGATANYNVTLRNNDSSSCGSSTFNFADSAPSGWSAVYNTGALSLAPGASGSVTLSVVAPAGTPNGTYSVFASASNSSATGYTASATGSETIYTQPPMTISIGSSQSSYVPGQKVSLSATVMSGTSPVSGASVTVNIRKSNGSAVSVSGRTGSNGVAVVSYTVKKNDPAGTWTAVASSNGVSASTSFAVQ